MVQEQYFSVCPKEMAVYFKKGKLKFIQKLGEKAENYVKALATEVVFGINPKPFNIQSLKTETRQCYNCKEVRHLQNQCLKPRLPRQFKNNPCAFFSQYSPVPGSV